jgi:hypothetical protein
LDAGYARMSRLASGFQVQPQQRNGEPLTSY